MPTGRCVTRRYTQCSYAVSSTTIRNKNKESEQAVRSTECTNLFDRCHIYFCSVMKLSLSVSGYCIMLQIWCIKLQTFKCEPNTTTNPCKMSFTWRLPYGINRRIKYLLQKLTIQQVNDYINTNNFNSDI